MHSCCARTSRWTMTPCIDLASKRLAGATTWGAASTKLLHDLVHLSHVAHLSCQEKAHSAACRRGSNGRATLVHATHTTPLDVHTIAQSSPTTATDAMLQCFPPGCQADLYQQCSNHTHAVQACTRMHTPPGSLLAQPVLQRSLPAGPAHSHGSCAETRFTCCCLTAAARHTTPCPHTAHILFTSNPPHLPHSPGLPALLVL